MSSDDNQRDDGDDDALLRALGARARTRRAHLDEEGGAADARAAEVFAPLDAAAHARFADAIQDRVRGPAGAGAPVAQTPAIRPLFRARRRVLVAAGASGLLAAAAVLLFVVTGPRGLVAYGLEIDGGDQRTRAAPQAGAGDARPDGVRTLAPDSWLEIRARPERATAVGGSAAAAYVRAAGDEHAGPVAVAAEISAEGVVRWRGTARELFGDRRGELEIRVVIGRVTFSSPDQAFAAEVGRGSSQQVLAARVRVGP